MTAPTIDRVESWAIRFELPVPLVLGHMVIRHRDYVVLRLTTTDGLVGVAYCLSRGTPVDLTLLDVVAPHCLGRDSADIASVIDGVSAATISVGPCGILGRAVSMLDIALWDIAAQRQGLPLWQLLGEARSTADVLLVEGYPRADEGPGAFAQRMASRAESGASWLKLANVPDEADMTERIVRTRAALGSSVQLVVDAAWAWQDVDHAIRLVESWEEHELAWVEDPAVISRIDYFRTLRDAVATPIGAGDEASDRTRVRELVDADGLDVLRYDAVTGGGVSGFSEAQALAETRGLVVSPHVYPELHRHFAFAFGNVGPVEWYGDSAEFDFSCRFADVKDGELSFARATAPSTPGVGLTLDWSVIEGASVRRGEVRADG